METKLDSRQGQFPASFPDTFKNFFAMMSEEEDHIDLFSNLLEDKVIPRANNKFTQRRYGGSLRCTTHPGSTSGGANNAGIGGSGGVGGGTGNHNVGRSNSFRVHRPRNSYASLSNIGGGIGSSSSSGSVANGSGSGNLFCKHIKYCCLHQQQQQQQLQQQQQKQPHKTSNQQLLQQQQQQHLSHAHHYCQQNYHPHDYASSNLAVGARLGPDGEDNNGVGISGGAGSALLLNDADVAAASKERQQQPPMHMSTQKRHSIILERAFDFDASCEESDTISTTSSTPTTNIPYSVLKPILKQPHQHTQNQKQQQQQHQALQQQSNTTAMHAATTKTVAVASQSKELPHRTLPQPPKGVGMGAYHTKESALHRIQQQSGLIAGSKTNLAALSGMQGSTTNIAGSCNAAGGGGASGNGTTTGGIGGSLSNNHYSGSNYNLNGSGGDGTNMYIDLHSPTAQLSSVNKFNDLLTASSSSGGGGGGGMTNLSSTSRSNLSNIRAQKSPILQRRRSSSIVANLLTADITYNRGVGCSNAAVGVGVATTGTGAATADDINNIRTHAGVANVSGAGATMPHSNTRDRICMAKSPVSNKPTRIPFEGSGVLTFQQAISGAVSPQYSATSPLMHMVGGMGVGSTATGLDMMGSSTALASVLEDSAATSDGICPDALTAGDSPTNNIPYSYHERFAERAVGGGGMGACVGGSSILHSSSATIAQLGNKQRQRLRTSSMPAESRKPRLADTRRAAIHCADIDLEYYRLRSFSITSHGVCNLGDSLRSRRSRSINSVTSTGTSNSGKDRHNSNASRTSGDNIFEANNKRDTTIDAKGQIPAYKIAMLGGSGVGKTTLTYQFTTSDYICAYDLSLDDDYGQKTVSVLVDGIETDLEIIDHPACEMSTEAFCSTYNIDLFVVGYSVVDRSSFKAAEKVLQYLKENEMLLTRGAILVGNKTDLERHREVTRQMGRKLAKEIACKFIETSSGLDHNVDELLVGIVAQVKLNPQRIRNLSERDRQRLNLQSTIQKHRRMHMPPRRIVRQMSMCQADGDDEDDCAGVDAGDHDRDENHSNNAILSSNGDEGIGTGSERTASTSLSSSATSKSTSKGPVRKTNKRTLNLESILKMGESELEDEEEAQRLNQYYQQATPRPQTKFELLTSGGAKSAGRTPFATPNSSPKSRQSNESSSAGSGVGKKSVASGSAAHYRDAPAEENLLDDEPCNRKTVSKLTIRTKVFLSSVLKFKKAINVAKRRSSSSCSDLFVI